MMSSPSVVASTTSTTSSLSSREDSLAMKKSRKDFESNETKPTARGYIHRFAFFAYILASTILLYFCKPGIPRLSIAVYLATLLNLYGISSVLHITRWRCIFAELRLTRVDHASIYLLIAGTYTPICLSCIPPGETPWAIRLLAVVWTIAILGVIKSMLWVNSPRWLNVAFYFICGLVIVPFLPIISAYINTFGLVCCALGGAIYLLGGLVYGARWPNPSPKHFGFHEIFHLFTVLANICFLPLILECVLA